jgi:hypothetical protein
MWNLEFPILKNANIRAFDGETCFSILDYHAVNCIVNFRKIFLEQRMIRVKIKSAFPPTLNDFMNNIILNTKQNGNKKLLKQKVSQFRDLSYKSQKSSIIFSF